MSEEIKNPTKPNFSLNKSTSFHSHKNIENKSPSHVYLRKLEGDLNDCNYKSHNL